MAVLVAVMVYVSYATFEWHSIAPRTLKNMPKSETAVMLITVIPTVVTGNLAIGVGLGVLAAMIAFVFGVGAMFAMFYMLRALLRLQSRGNLNYASAVGEEAVLTVLAKHNAKLGLLFLDIKRAAEALSKLV